MTCRCIWNIIPVPIFYTDRIKDGFAGRSFGFWIKIRPKYREDEGLLAHELVHCKQFYRTCFIHALLYKYSKKWRYKSELESYKIQSLYEHSVVAQKSAAKLFAGFIATKYRLDVTEDEAFKDLCKLLEI